jgi:hypothetical protein
MSKSEFKGGGSLAIPEQGPTHDPLGVADQETKNMPPEGQAILIPALFATLSGALLSIFVGRGIADRIPTSQCP